MNIVAELLIFVKKEMMFTTSNSPRILLSLLWVTILFLMVFADVFSIIIEMEIGGTMEIPMDVKTAMAMAAIVTSIPISMIVLSYVLPYKTNRVVTILVAAFTIVYVVGGGSTAAHYLILAGVEVVLLMLIIRIASTWKQ